MAGHNDPSLSAKPSSHTAASRSSRASTLPSSQPGEQQQTPSAPAVPPHKHSNLADTGRRYYNKHYPHHSRHQSQPHQHSHGSHHAATHHHHSAASELRDLLSPVKDGLREALGARSTGTSNHDLGGSMKVFSRGGGDKVNKSEQGLLDSINGGSSREREATNSGASSSRKHSVPPSEVDVRKLKAAARRREESLATSYNSIAAQTIESSLAISRTHDSLLQTLASSRETLSKLVALRDSSAALLSTMTKSTIPDLAASSQERLATLQRLHADTESSQLAGLEARVNAARERAAALRARVEVCAEKVRREEGRVREERKRRRWWVGFVWVLLGIGVLVWVGVAVWKNGWAESGERGEAAGLKRKAELRRRLDEKGVGWVLDDNITDDINNNNDNNNRKSEVEETTLNFDNLVAATPISTEQYHSDERDERLARIFDEL